MKSSQLAFLLTQFAWLSALPTSFEILEGSAELVLAGQELSVQVSDRSQLAWNEFSINADEQIVFHQPSSQSLVINHVTGNERSQLLGLLKANGRVILLNPNGIIFGKEATIDTGSFIASTLDLNQKLFKETGNLEFTNTSHGRIVNDGLIQARSGDLFLIGHQVEHRGVLIAEGNLAGTIGCHSLLLKEDEIGRVLVCDTGLHSDPYKSSYSVIDGRFVNPNGTTYILGDTVGILKKSQIDVSSPHAGGNLFIGGGYQGKDPNLMNSSWTFAEAGAEFNANALELGNAGQIILWSNEGTYFHGDAFAEGGRHGGNGGFIEISGGTLDLKGRTSTLAANGKTGDLLLDPFDITISAAGDTPALFTPFGPTFYTSSGGGCGVSGGAILTPATLIGSLAGNNVTIQTGAGGGCPGDIYVISPVTYASGNSLTLQALNSIFVRADIQNTSLAGGGDVTLIATNTIEIGTPGANTSVGSRSGASVINAPGANVRLQSYSTDTSAQLGFHVAANDPTPLPGPIRCTCANLTLQGSLVPGADSQGAAIGHGDFALDFNMFMLFRSFSTTSAATIDVRASGDITMLSGNRSNSAAFIGHGATQLNDGAVAFGVDLRGDITVDCCGNLLMQNQGGFVTAVTIGHGCIRGSFATPVGTATTTTISADIHVFAGGDICMLGSGGVCASNTAGFLGPFNDNTIGHFLDRTNSITGDIDVQAGGDIKILGNTSGQIHRIGIGYITLNPIPMSIATGNIRVSACRDLIMHNNRAQYCLIGTNNIWSRVNQTVSVAAGRDLTMAGAVTNGGGARIGVMSNAGPNTSTTHVAVGRDLTMSGPSQNVIDAYGNVFVAAGQNVLSNPIFRSQFIGTETLNGGFLTRIWAGRSVLGQFISPGVRSIFGQGDFAPAALQNHSLDIRAGSDIQMANSFTTTTGTIYFEADTQLPAGALWTLAGGSIISIAGDPTSPIAIFNPLCPNVCSQNTAANSFPVIANCSGTFYTAPGASGISYTTTSGDITFHSGDGAITFGNANPTDVFLSTVSGDIEVYGVNVGNPCLRCSFDTVTIDQSITTSGTVLMVANGDLTITSNGSIDTSSGPSPVTLVVDNAFPALPLLGPGRFIMDPGSFINTGTAPLNIYTVQPNLNTINGLLNGSPFGSPLPVPGPFLVDTCYEQWCTYYCAFMPATCGTSPNPPATQFTFAYKICPFIIDDFNGPGPGAIISQMLVDLHPYNEFPGWAQIFWVQGDLEDYSFSEPYYLGRRKLNFIKHAKSWTQLFRVFWGPSNSDEKDHWTGIRVPL